MKIFIIALSLLLSEVSAAPSPKTDFSFDALAKIPMQDRGRVKPLDTAARETVLFVTGKRTYQGWNSVELFLSWLIYPDQWREEKIFFVGDVDFKKQVGLASDRKYFSFKELMENRELHEFLGRLSEKEGKKIELTPVEKKGSAVHGKVSLFAAVVQGSFWRVIPRKFDPRGRWFSLSELGTGEGEGRGSEMDTLYTASQKREVEVALHKMAVAYPQGDATAFTLASQEFAASLKKLPQAGIYPSSSKIDLEMAYNQWRPFQKALWFYLLGFVILLLSLIGLFSRRGHAVAYIMTVVGLAIHVSGFVLRCLIAGRAPVTNMYESVIWVSFGVVFLGLFLEAIYKKKFILCAATAVSAIGLLIADQLPAVLDAGIHPLEPVLRSNFWLTIHVLTITLSYACFALALGIGNVALGYFLFSPRNKERIAALQLYLYRAVQVGVILLAAGTILGGVWADYSWGRFWGWDPKEVWALISLLCYLAVLHGRYAGWLGSFGIVASSVLCFLAILMAWYGVNFVLGVGLHSYGFASGGFLYVATYAFLQLLYVAVSKFRYTVYLRNSSYADQ